MPIVGLLVARVDPRKLLGLGIVGASITLYDLSRLNLNAGYWDISVQGIALALLFVRLTTATMDSIRREEMGNATSLFNFMRNIGGSFGIALATTMLARGSDAVTALEQAYAALGGLVQRQAYLLSFVHVFQLLAVIFVAVVPFLFLMRRPRKGKVVAGH